MDQRFKAHINIEDYDYDLPDWKIAKHPLPDRDGSKLLYYKGGKISHDIFRNITSYIPGDSLLVFNNTSVIRARLLFTKETGAAIEVFCLEPLKPSEYETAFSSPSPSEWKCIVGNLRKWKEGKLQRKFFHEGKEHMLTAEKVNPEGEAWRIRFDWDHPGLNFGEVIDIAGHIPLPPYLNREDEENDNIRYQTVYSSIKGSVAAPTAGLHFTEDVLESMKARRIESAEITLHVGAGTFKPVKSKNLTDHSMHCEHFFITAAIIEKLIKYSGRIIPVGTTSVRTLESLYWLGIRALKNRMGEEAHPCISQWEPYIHESQSGLAESLSALLEYMLKTGIDILHASTSVMIVPGYKFRMTDGLITNFHQPRSTLLLLVSAWTGNDWKSIYRYALENEFRFLSYGDSSLLMR
jgi:S-adenosylmethionine:tRNA ribosyltransferase-isomerase